MQESEQHGSPTGGFEVDFTALDSVRNAMHEAGELLRAAAAKGANVVLRPPSSDSPTEAWFHACQGHSSTLTSEINNLARKCHARAENTELSNAEYQATEGGVRERFGTSSGDSGG